MEIACNDVFCIFVKYTYNSKTSKMTLSTDREKMTFRVFWQVVSEFRCRI